MMRSAISKNKLVLNILRTNGPQSPQNIIHLNNIALSTKGNKAVPIKLPELTSDILTQLQTNRLVQCVPPPPLKGSPNAKLKPNKSDWLWKIIIRKQKKPIHPLDLIIMQEFSSVCKNDLVKSPAFDQQLNSLTPS